ncbi:MAG: nucleotidyltransferase family protein [Ruminococcus sp.]
MKVSAVICEFNPFHKGHKYLLDSVRAENNQCIVTVMSGSFTQRGDVGVFSKFARAEAALKNGADIVIELPVPWAVASAQRFAKGGCEIIKALGSVDSVYFGSECGDAGLIQKACEATLDERVNNRLKALIKSGEYYPSALEKAVFEFFGEETAKILSEPNNTLGLEYCKELRGSSIEIKTVKRVGAGHDSEEVIGDFASASAVRSKIKSGECYESLLPYITKEYENPAFMEYGERAMLVKLREMSAEDFEKLPDVSEGLHNRIYEAVRGNNSLEEILSAIKTKRYTMARLRRILTCAMLGVTKDMQSIDVPYIRVLGFTKTGAVLLKELNKTAYLPIVVNVADGLRNLTGDAKEVFETDIRATDIRTVFEKSPTPCGRDFVNGVIKV